MYCTVLLYLHIWEISKQLSNTNHKCAVASFLSPKFKRVSENETPEFFCGGLNFCVDFDFDIKEIRKKMENINKLNIIKFHVKNLSFGLWEKFKQTFSIQKKIIHTVLSYLGEM